MKLEEFVLGVSEKADDLSRAKIGELYDVHSDWSVCEDEYQRNLWNVLSTQYEQLTPSERAVIDNYINVVRENDETFTVRALLYDSRDDKQCVYRLEELSKIGWRVVNGDANHLVLEDPAGRKYPLPRKAEKPDADCPVEASDRATQDYLIARSMEDAERDIERQFSLLLSIARIDDLATSIVSTSIIERVCEEYRNENPDANPSK